MILQYQVVEGLATDSGAKPKSSFQAMNFGLISQGHFKEQDQ
jgi:hypothetical protein